MVGRAAVMTAEGAGRQQVTWVQLCLSLFCSAADRPSSLICGVSALPMLSLNTCIPDQHILIWTVSSVPCTCSLSVVLLHMCTLHQVLFVPA